VHLRELGTFIDTTIPTIAVFVLGPGTKKTTTTKQETKQKTQAE